MRDREHTIRLVRAAQAGDDTSFEQLVRGYQDLAVFYATSILRDYHLAEDVSQEAFVEAHQQLRTLREPAAFGSWFRKIIFKHCDRIKRRRQHVITGLDEAAGAPSSEPLIQQKVESQESDTSIWKAIASLNNAEQTVILLYYMGEYSHSAIAEFLGINTNTVKTRLYSARRHLREMITDRVQHKLHASRPSSNRMFERRVMSATLSLQLYYVDDSGNKRPAGSTAGKRSAEVPAMRTWIVEPQQRLTEKEWERLISLMGEMEVPGLIIPQQVPETVLRRIARLNHLRYLDLSGSQITDDYLSQLPHLPRLEHLNLSCPEITDRGLTVLRNLPRLRTLEMYHQRRITDQGIANLEHCNRLERVNLMGTNTGDKSIKTLADKQRLSHFFAGNNVTDAGLALMHQFPVFKKWHGGAARMSLMEFTAEPNYLWLNLNAPITNVGLSKLAGLEGIFALNLFGATRPGPFDDAGSLVTSAGLGALSELPNLGWLGCNASLCTDHAMRWISSIPQLRFLMCQDAVAGDDGFAALSRSQTIEYIWGRRCYNLTSTGFAALSTMPRLRGLSVTCRNVDDRGLARLTDFRSLREFMPMDVPDAGFRHVARCERLASLHCMYCDEIGDVAISQISSLPELRTCQIWGTKITDVSLTALGRTPSLEHLGLHNCRSVTNRGLSQLRSLPNLRRVDLENLRGVTPEAVNVFPARVRVNYLPGS